MKKGTKFIIIPILMISLLFSSCIGRDREKSNVVTIYMWGGSDSINEYMDKWVAPRLKEEKNIILKRVPISTPKDIINKLITEKQANKQSGSADIIWMNGENFKAAKESQILYGPFTHKLSNFNKYIDGESKDVKYDFGEETNGLEAPWGKVQFVYIYDSNRIKNPPRSFEELREWVKKNPGKFTYPAASDFTGSAFIRQALFETCGGYEGYLKPMDVNTIGTAAVPLWNYLNDIEAYLWQGGKTYPESLSKLDQLYSNGEVWMTMGYDEARAHNEIKKGTVPSSTKTMIFDAGTLANTHFLTIPFNSPNKDGAEAVIDFLLSPEAQITKFNPLNWGDGLALDYSKLPSQYQKQIDSVDRGDTTLPVDELESHRVPEIEASYVNFLEKGWMENVGKN